MTTISPQLFRDERSMALPDNQDKSTARMSTVSYLVTPPENIVDSFSSAGKDEQPEVTEERWAKTTHILPPIVHTPPASPENNTLPSISSYSVRDRLLYPEDHRTDLVRSQRPLFEEEDHSPTSPVTHSLAEASISDSDSASGDRALRRSDIFPFNLHIKTGEDALRYYKDRVAEHNRMRAYQLPWPQRSSSSNLDPISTRQLHALSRSAGVAKPRSTPRVVAKPKASVATSPVKTSPPKRRAPKERTYSDFVSTAFPPKEPSTKHKRAPPSKKVEGDNVNWTELPNYAPPSSDLDKNPKTLKVSWHGHALPLHDDPDQDEMHEQEIQVASTLRLNCATYLTNKRKIFQGRLQSLKDGKNFTKTAAQSACKIDVNKASQLWEAFDRVGWFNPEWYKQWL